jgi:hypothetical protein
VVAQEGKANPSTPSTSGTPQKPRNRPIVFSPFVMIKYVEVDMDARIRAPSSTIKFELARPSKLGQ